MFNALHDFVRNECQVPDWVRQIQAIIPCLSQVMQGHNIHLDGGREFILHKFTGCPDIFLRIVAARNYRYPDVERDFSLGNGDGITENQFI